MCFLGTLAAEIQQNRRQSGRRKKVRSRCRFDELGALLRTLFVEDTSTQYVQSLASNDKKRVLQGGLSESYS